MNIYIQIFVIGGLGFLLIKNIKAIKSITIQETKSKTLKISAALLFAIILVTGLYFSATVFHYLLTILASFIILLNPHTSGISTSKNKFIHNSRREVLFLSYPEEVNVSNVSDIEIKSISPDKFSITYFFNKRYNRLYFSNAD